MARCPAVRLRVFAGLSLQRHAGQSPRTSVAQCKKNKNRTSTLQSVGVGERLVIVNAIMYLNAICYSPLHSLRYHISNTYKYNTWGNHRRNYRKKNRTGGACAVPSPRGVRGSRRWRMGHKSRREAPFTAGLTPAVRSAAVLVTAHVCGAKHTFQGGPGCASRRGDAKNRPKRLA